MGTGRSKVYEELQTAETRERLLKVAKRILGDEEESKDACHDAVVQALTASDDFRSEAKPGTWIHRIVVNTSLMRRRRGRTGEQVAEDIRFDEELTPRPLLSGAAVEEHEDRLRLRHAVEQLPEAYKVVVERQVYAEEPTERVASSLGLTVSAVKMRMGRARDQLVQILAQMGRKPAVLTPTG